MLCWPGLEGQGTEPGQGAAMPCPAPGNRFRARGTCQGHLGHSCTAALSWWVGLARCGDTGGSLRTQPFILALFVSVTALQSLEEDTKLHISSLAAQTILILSTPRVQRTSRCTLRALCCWCC